MQNLINRIKGLFQSPIREWETIKIEYLPNLWNLLYRYYLPIFLLVFLSFFIVSLIKTGFSRSLISSGILAPFLLFLLFIFALYLLGLILEEVSELMGNPVSPTLGIKLSFFSAYPLMYSLIFLPIPYLGLAINLLCLFYFFYLLTLATEYVLGISGKKRFFFNLTVIIASLFVFFIISLIFLILSFLANLIL